MRFFTKFVETRNFIEYCIEYARKLEHGRGVQVIHEKVHKNN